MYWAGVTQGLMWKEFNSDGFLQYGNFLETVVQLIPMYQLRAVGGLLFIIGSLIMAYNLYKTAKAGQFLADEEAQATPYRLKNETEHKHPWGHRWLEARPMTLTVLAFVAVFIGGAVEFVPMYLVKSNVPTISSVKPYSALELLGRDIYIREGCVGCHSQMIRPFRSETERYGEYSKAGEFVFDHPFLWGSKRTGPDLQRVGGKYSDAWHYNHMDDPKTMSTSSIMPAYPWLLTQEQETDSLPARIKALRKVGVPYPEGFENGPAQEELEAQSATIVANLSVGSVEAEPDREIIAVIAYLQRLGIDIKAEPAQTAQTEKSTSTN
jgi:cytochrome c oxidase cbb3-type subunit I/II